MTVFFYALFPSCRAKRTTEINRDIKSELYSFAVRDGISYAEARKKVSKSDTALYKKEAAEVVRHAKELRKQGKRVSYADYSDEVNERMRLYNVTMRINRLEYLKSVIGIRLVELGADINNELNVKLDADTRTEFQRQAEFLMANDAGSAMDWWTQSAVQKIVMASTGSGTYSNRLWTSIDALKARLETTLAQVLIGGQNPRKAAQQLRAVVQKDVGNIKHITERIARTESARCQTQATLESFDHYGVEWCQWTAEPNACPTCAEHARHNDGVYRVKDVPTLPAHPNCRCALSAYWKKREELSRDEIGAIKSYKSSESYKINYALRHEEKLSEAQRNLVTNLDNAIDKLPKYSSKSPLYRSYSNGWGFDSMEFVAESVKKGKLEDSAFVSTSTDIYDPNDDLRVIILKSKSGAVLGKYDETEEKEVLFPRNAVFKVVKCYTERRESDKLVPIIEVTEVE